MEEILKQMIRVNHAGEYGAVRIYQGQRAILGASSVGPSLEHMEAQEKEHKVLFEELLVQHQVRPTALSPLWHVLGYALGIGSALLGKRAAMAATVAVEEVIEEHYNVQLRALKETPGTEDLVRLIERCKADEIAHKKTALEEKAQEMKGYQPFTLAVKAASKVAIWLSKRI